MKYPVYFSDLLPLMSVLIGGFVMIITLMRHFNIRHKITADFNLNFYLIGMILAQLLTLFLVNMESRQANQLYTVDDVYEDDYIQIPRTILEKPKVVLPPAPKVEKPNIKPVLTKTIELLDNTKEINDPINRDTEIDAYAPPVPVGDPMPAPVVPEPIIEKEDTEPIRIAEQMPRFPGCEDLDAGHEEKRSCADAQLLKYIYTHLKYPAIARESGIEGMVVLQFVVAEDGTVTDIKILRDPGAGCGKAAKKVVQAMNKLSERWTPGRQRGRAVKVLYTLPVSFKLN